jgi:hypothetical protein
MKAPPSIYQLKITLLDIAPTHLAANTGPECGPVMLFSRRISGGHGLDRQPSSSV